MNRIAGLLSAVAAVGAPASALAQTSPVPEAPPPGSLGAQFAALRSSPASRAAGAGAAAAPGADPSSAPVARRVIDSAGAFDAYMRQASAVEPHFRNGPAVAKALTVAAAYEPRQLGEGAVAYTALVALQDPVFVESVREAGAGPQGAVLADRLMADPRLVLDLPGAADAAVRAAALIGARGSALAQSGAAVGEAAYSVQREPWSKGAVQDTGGRLSRVKLASATRGALGASDTDALMTSLVGLRRAGISTAPDDYHPTGATARGLAVAALAVLGRGGEDHAEEVGRLLADPEGADCLKMAKLNLYQCLAVAGPHYEDMFCLGRHALADTGRCMVASAGWRGPIGAAPVLTVARQALPPSASVAVPMAGTALDGPERAAAFDPAPEGAAPPPAYQVARTDVPSFDSTPRHTVDPYDDDRGPPPGPGLRDRGYDDWGRPLADPYGAAAPYGAGDPYARPDPYARGYADPGYYARAGYGYGRGPADR